MPPDSTEDASALDPPPLVAELRSSLLGGEPSLTAAEVAERGGVPRDLTRRLWRAMGFADVPDDETAFTEVDLDAVRRTAALMSRDGLDGSDLLHLARVLGQASARMADSVIGFAAARLADQDSDVAPRLLDELDNLTVYLLNRHLLDALRRYLGEGANPPDATDLTVGFADLVGFTRLSQRLDDTELADLVEEFEAVASDTIVVNGGRVVKMIGDEVMFAADAPAAIEIGLLLAESFTDPEMPGVRVGMACGSVVTRAGDLFGPTVNLAARATGMARPGSVLVSSDLFDAAGADGRYHLKRLRPRRLKGIGWADLGAVTRARPATAG